MARNNWKADGFLISLFKVTKEVKQQKFGGYTCQGAASYSNIQIDGNGNLFVVDGDIDIISFTCQRDHGIPYEM